MSRPSAQNTTSPIMLPSKLICSPAAVGRAAGGDVVVLTVVMVVDATREDSALGGELRATLEVVLSPILLLLGQTYTVVVVTLLTHVTVSIFVEIALPMLVSVDRPGTTTVKTETDGCAAASVAAPRPKSSERRMLLALLWRG